MEYLKAFIFGSSERYFSIQSAVNNKILTDSNLMSPSLRIHRRPRSRCTLRGSALVDDDLYIANAWPQGWTSYVRASEVMSILGITRNTLCDWINAGTLPAFRLGKNNVCDPAELAAFLETRRTGV